MGRVLVVFKRVMQAIPTIVGIVIITFLLTRALPGDPAAFFAGRCRCNLVVICLI
jgi:ABC-type dipeptide/oligopeptide/nickel transport system permease component